ncbi:hypothetical protein OG322_40765 [Streptomyces sp. NBC_01260]|uniref:hypothetical protein n=1 Tax=Streptomyces sp. NBC_01260 TaxID=2903801 RepID=UPI002E32A007|nr:hypothetical protein [Streptomyces sp. NBC_01260]
MKEDDGEENGEFSTESNTESNGILTGIWSYLGIGVGLFLMLDYVYSLDLKPGEKPSWEQDVVFCSLLLGPIALLSLLGEELAREIRKGKLSYSTYWSTFFAVTAAVCTFLGITSIEDVKKIFDSWDW